MRQEADGNKVTNDIIFGPGKKKYRFCKVKNISIDMHFLTKYI